MTQVFSANGLIITDESIGSGTGNYSTFLRIHDTGQSADAYETGFNTDSKTESLTSGVLSDMDPAHSQSLKLSSIPVVNIGGTDYLQFGLDINQSKLLLQLTEFKVYQAATGDVTSQALLGTPTFDMDAGTDGDQTVDLPDVGKGSGTSDFAFHVPKAAFTSEYVYVYATFINADGGFEEWGVGKSAAAPVSLADPAFTVEKTVNKSSVNGPDTLTYTVTVDNTGTTGLHVSISDPGYAVGTAAGDLNSNNILDTNETWTYTFTRAVSQSDIDQGTKLVNTVGVTTEAGTKSASASTSITQNPSIDVTKSVTEASVNAANQTIHYSISVKNDGNVTLNAPEITDAGATVDSGYSGDSDHDGLLDVGETWIYSATHAVTQDEIDHGDAIRNIASASSDTLYTDLDARDGSNEVSTTIVQNLGLDVAKALNPYATGGTYGHTDSGNAPVILVGDKDGHSANTTLSWEYKVANTGNVTLKNVFVSDDILGMIDLNATLLAPEALATGTKTESAANVAGLHTNTATAGGTMLYGTSGPGDIDTGAYVGAQGQIAIDKMISVDNGVSWSQGPVTTFANMKLAYKITVSDKSDTGLHVSGIAVSDTQATVTGVATDLAHGGTDDSNLYYTTATGTGGTNTASVTATVSDDYGHSMSLSATDSVSYVVVQAQAGLSKGYWANHAWDSHTSSTITLGDTNYSYNCAGDKYAITFDSAAALQMDNSSTTGDARIILGGQLIAAQLNTYMNHSTATGLLDAGAKWFYKYGGQDDNTAKDTASNDALTASGQSVRNDEWVNDKKNGFVLNEGAAVSTSSTNAWKGDLFSFNYKSQIDGQVHKVGVTGEGLKNALAAYDHGLSGSDGLVVASDGSLIAWQGGSSTYFQYDNTATTFNGDKVFWDDLKGGAFIAVLNDAELANKVSIVGIHDDHGNNN